MFGKLCDSVVPVLKDIFAKRGSADETVKEFFERRFGSEVSVWTLVNTKFKVGTYTLHVAPWNA